MEYLCKKKIIRCDAAILLEYLINKLWFYYPVDALVCKESFESHDYVVL